MSCSLRLSGEWISRNWLGRDVIIKSKVFYSLVGKWTNCSKWWSFKILMNFSPSDRLSGEPDLLSLSGQTMSQKLKSPRIWTEGSLLPLCISLIFSSWLSNDLSCDSSFSESPPGGRYQLATKWEVLFANTFTQTDSESFSSSVMGICEISLWISNITPPPSRVLSFLYTLYGQDSGNNSEVDMELSIFVSWIATIWSWWKSRKANNSSFLPLILLIFMLTNFNPLLNLFFLSDPVWEAFVPLPFANGSNLFWFS